MTVIQATIFNQANNTLGEISPAWDSISWRLNGEGMAKFSMPYSDRMCRRDVLRTSNRLYIALDNGLPAWGGVIDLPETQDDKGVSETAYTGERILAWRETGKNDVFELAAPGSIFRSLIENANGTRNTGIEIGDIFTGGTQISRTFHLHELLTQFQKLASDSGMDFGVLPVYSAGRLSFRAHWYERRGRDLRGQVKLIEGNNVQSANRTRQGNIANRILLAGGGPDWSEDRYVADESDAASVSEFDYREWGEVDVGITHSPTLDANAAEKLAQMAWPVNSISLNMLNADPSPFADYDVGDIVSAELFLKSSEWVYEGNVRIIAREFTPGTGQCRLEIQEWLD